MGNLFGRSKKPRSRISEQDKAVLQLKQQRDKMKQYQKKIMVCLEKERLLAKQLIQENKKDKAKLLLRKKKFQEQLLDKTNVQLDNLERMVHDIEFAQVELQVIEGLKVGNEALKKMHEILSVDEIERILDETNEGIEKQREIDEMLSDALTVQDEDDVLKELDALMSENEPELELPEVPTAQLEAEEIGRKEKPRKKVAEAIAA